MTAPMVAAGLLAAALLQVETAHVIVDTDAGTDDLMAIAFLLARKDVKVDAITVVNGLAHVRPGAENVLRLLALSGRADIPVYMGAETPLQKTAEFPAEWRRISDELPGVNLPRASRQPETESASQFLARPHAGVTLLALGPLTNLVKARLFQRIVIMGGAIRAPGNLGDGGLYKTTNTRAEWNIFSDPAAARIVFESGAPLELVPLDATSKAPIDVKFLNEIKTTVTTSLGTFVAQVLESDRKIIEDGYFQAWDPLAAVAVVEPAVLRWSALGLTVTSDGITAERKGRANAKVALDADAGAFRRVFLRAFAP